MGRFRTVLRIGIAAVIIGIGGSAHAQKEGGADGSGTAADSESRLAGEWTGKYVCKQGVTGMRLLVTVMDGRVRAVAHFYPLPENRAPKEGCFAMSGSYDAATGRVILGGGNWIIRPAGYLVIDLAGTVDPAGTSFHGEVAGAPNCSIFSLTRAPSSRPMPSRCEAAVR